MGLLPSTFSPDATCPNYERAFASRPAVYAAWRGLVAAITVSMDERDYEVATLGAARALRSTYCSLAHGSVLLERHVDEPGLIRLLAAADARQVTDGSTRDEAVAAFAARVARGAADLTQADIDAVLEAGLTEQEAFDVILAAAARCFFSTVLDATGTRADSALRQRLGPELVGQLVAGRPA